MLTADLLVSRIKRGRVCPFFQSRDDEELQARAAFIIKSFEDGAGQRRGELRETLDGFLKGSTSIKVDRGLVKLCMDRCDFAMAAPLSPVEIRALVFEKAFAARAAGAFDRAAVLTEAAAELELADAAAVEEGLYADLKDNERLESFDSLSPVELIDRYNLGLAQAVLFRAVSLTITIQEDGPRTRRLFRALKFFRLLHRVFREDEGYRIEVDGPMSLFSLSQQYGLRMASFLPTLALGQDWSMEAELRWGPKKTPRRFVLDGRDGLRSHRADTGVFIPDEIKDFAVSWPKDADWLIHTDADIIDLGGQGVLIPDFRFTHKRAKREVAMDILGYWNRGSLKRRLALLREHGPDNLILALSRSLCIDKDGKSKEELGDLPGEIYLFRSLPLQREILKRLERWAPKKRAKKSKKKTLKKAPTPKKFLGPRKAAKKAKAKKTKG